MDYNYYFGGEFETFKKSKWMKKPKKKLWKKTRKFFKKLCNKVIDMFLSTASQIAIRFFDKKFEKAFAY
jgi:hypothetical protein